MENYDIIRTFHDGSVVSDGLDAIYAGIVKQKYDITNSLACKLLIKYFSISSIVVFCIRDYISWIQIISILMKSFGNLGLHWWFPEGRNMSAIWDEEAFYHN